MAGFSLAIKRGGGQASVTVCSSRDYAGKLSCWVSWFDVGYVPPLSSCLLVHCADCTAQTLSSILPPPQLRWCQTLEQRQELSKSMKVLLLTILPFLSSLMYVGSLVKSLSCQPRLGGDTLGTQSLHLFPLQLQKQRQRSGSGFISPWKLNSKYHYQSFHLLGD